MSTPIPEHKSCFLHGDYDEDRCPGCERHQDVMAHSIERLAAQAVVRRAVNRLEPHLGCVTCRRPLDNGWCGWCDPKSGEPDRDVTTHTCARCGQLYDPSLHHACLDGSTARSILSSALTGTRPYDQAGRAIKKLADHGYSIVPTLCRHSIYHHGCPSCDRQDPEDK